MRKDEGEDCIVRDALEHPKRHEGILGQAMLGEEKQADRDESEHDQAYDLLAAPREHGAAKVQPDTDQTGDGDDKQGAEPVDGHETLAELGSRVVHVQEDNGQANDKRADGDVDPEAPAPGHRLRESTSDQGANRPGNSPHEAGEAHIQGPLADAEQVRDDDDGNLDQAAAGRALYRTGGNQHGHARAECCEDAGGGKGHERREMDALAAPDVTELCPYRARGGVGQQVGTPYPDVACGRVQVGADGGDGLCDDGRVERGQE